MPDYDKFDLTLGKAIQMADSRKNYREIKDFVAGSGLSKEKQNRVLNILILEPI